MKIVHAPDERIHKNGGSLVKNRNIFSHIKAEFFTSGKKDSFFKKLGNILALLALKVSENFLLLYEFRRNNNPFGKIIKKSRREFINKGNISVRSGNGKSRFDSFNILFDVLLYKNAVFSPLF